MAEEFLHIRKEDLSQFEDILLIGQNSGKSCAALMFNAITGYSGAVYANPDGHALSGMARLVDADQVGLSKIQGKFPTNLLALALGKSNRLTPDQKQSRSAILKMLLLRVAREDLPLLGGAYADADLLNFISLGDTAARCQAVRAFPLMRQIWTAHPHLAGIIDARQPLAPALRALHGLDVAAFGRYSAIEATISHDLRDITDPKILNPRFGMISGYLNEAILAARTVSLEHLPRSFEDCMDMLRFARTVIDERGSSHLGASSFERFLAQAHQSGWTASELRLRNMGVPDAYPYLKEITRALSTVVAMTILRDECHVDFERLAEMSALIFSKEDLTFEQAASAMAFIDSFMLIIKEMPYCAQVIQEIIGDAASLKDICEFKARWQFNRETILDAVMGAQSHIAWTPLIGTINLGSMIARELSDSESLEAQGKDEKHCVGGYTSRVFAGAHNEAGLIFSLESSDAVISTIEIGVEIKDGQVVWHSKQNKISQNASSTDTAVKLGRALIESLRTLPFAQVDSYVNGFNADTSEVKAALRGAMVAAAGNITSGSLPETILGAFANLLPKSLRSKAAADWIQIVAKTPEGVKFVADCRRVGRDLMRRPSISRECATLSL